MNLIRPTTRFRLLHAALPVLRSKFTASLWSAATPTRGITQWPSRSKACKIKNMINFSALASAWPSRSTTARQPVVGQEPTVISGAQFSLKQSIGLKESLERDSAECPRKRREGGPSMNDLAISG